MDDVKVYVDKILSKKGNVCAFLNININGRLRKSVILSDIELDYIENRSELEINDRTK